ncbi:MAG: DUF1800 family protein [Verrucomicrobia bacterium]|nr:DUF1800 family protein [Verrucomicrobiota bacterium]
MPAIRVWCRTLATWGGALLSFSPMVSVSAAEGLQVQDLEVVGGEARLSFKPAPAVENYQVFRSPSLEAAFEPAPGVLRPGGWSGATAGEAGFFQIRIATVSTNDLLAANVLQRLAYGPTPDDLAQLRAVGPESYMAAQLAAESVPSDLDTADPAPRWVRVTTTGPGTASRLYVYLDGAGEAYLDDLRLVAGDLDDGTQPNLLRNGDFEGTLSPSWTLSDNVAGSARSAQIVHSGGAALHLISTEAGTTQDSSLWQSISPALSASRNYTLSYWFRTSGDATRLTIRLSGSGIASEHGLGGEPNSPAPLYARLEAGMANRADLRAWHLRHAIASPRQLNEVLRQFLENHFVTQVSKTQDYFDGRGYDGDTAELLAVRTEFVENRRWREALLNPQVTFHDLLRISAESPAMIVYLDTVTSRGDGANIANENYARELCELFCFGVDNGYDQRDIEEISRAWTGWRLELVAPENEFNPHAPRSTTYLDPAVTGSGLNANTNVVGVWAMKYRPDRHNERAKYPFFQWDASGRRGAAKQVPARFGPPWAGRSYGLPLPARSGTSGYRDGLDILRHMADQPFTQEYLSVKLCQVFIHDGFQHGYDFTDAETSPEEALVHACMRAWEEGSPRGQVREVLRTIFASELFRSHGGSLQKVKTPLEFVASTLRALRARRPDGTWTADADGYELYGLMNRAGRMRLFDRAEPDGYPEDAPGWISGGTLAERLRFVQSALMPAGMAGKEDAGRNTRVDPVGLLQLSVPESQWRDADAVAAFFLRTLFPAEGTANLLGYHRIAVDFLNADDTGSNPSPLAGLVPGSSAYDLRIRGMVALLMSTQRFQEQ